MKKEVTRSQSNNARVEFHKHPPERRRGGNAKGCCCCGSCCCCCCLHSLGGLIGAAAASRRKQGVPGAREIGKYWLVLVLLTGLSVVLSSMFVMFGDTTALEMLIFLMFMPVIQLVCSVVIAVWVEVRRGENAAEKSAGRRTIGKITLWSFLGVVAGILAMILLFQMMK